MRQTVFIHTNDRQMLGAILSRHSLQRRASRDVDVQILRQEDHPFFAAHEGRTFLRGSEHRVWRNDDLQSFTPLRFMPPERMAYEGRAVVVDPDVFAVGDVCELLDRDMAGKAIMCVARPGHNNRPDYLASSVMLLDCAKLRHWRCEEQFEEMFAFRRDYLAWISLTLEPRETIGLLEPEWNHFDTLTESTRLLHNTKRRTQPWKTGLPIDFTVQATKPRLLTRRLRGLLPVMGFRRVYERHPDPAQERFVFSLLRECLDAGTVTEAMVREEMRRNHVRHDALDLVRRLPPAA